MKKQNNYMLIVVQNNFCETNISETCPVSVLGNGKTYKAVC